MRRLALVAAWLCGCAPSGASGPAAVGVSLPPAHATDPDAGGRGDATLSVPIPRGAPCELASAATSTRALEVAAEPAAPPFGTITRTSSLRAWLQPGGAAFTVEADVGGLVVRGVMPADALPLHVTRVATFGGILLPSGREPLSLASLRAGGLELHARVPDALEIGGQEKVAAVLPCAITSLDPGDFDAFETYFGAPIESAELTGDRIPIAKHPDGPWVASLVPSEFHSTTVEVLSRETHRVKIAWNLGDVFVFGWVDARAVRPHKPFGGMFGHTLGELASAPVAAPRWIPVSCQKELPLRVFQGGRSHVIGLVAPRTLILVVGQSAQGTSVEIAGGGLSRAPNVELTVDAKQALASCSWP